MGIGRRWLERARLARSDAHAADRLSALLDDELGDDEALTVTRHVVRCAACAAELEEVRRCREVLRALPRVDPPRELYDTSPESIADGRRRAHRLGRVAVAVGLSGAILGGIAFAVGGQESGTVAPAVDRYVEDHVARTDGGPVLNPVDLGR